MSLSLRRMSWDEHQAVRVKHCLTRAACVLTQLFFFFFLASWSFKLPKLDMLVRLLRLEMLSHEFWRRICMSGGKKERKPGIKRGKCARKETENRKDPTGPNLSYYLGCLRLLVWRPELHRSWPSEPRWSLSAPPALCPTQTWTHVIELGWDRSELHFNFLYMYLYIIPELSYFSKWLLYIFCKSC